MRRTRLLAVLIAPLLGAALSTALAPAAHAATGCLAGADDFDQNGGSDVAIGGSFTDVPTAQHGSGSVVVRMKTSDGIRNVTVLAPVHADAFGQSVAEVNLAGTSGPADLCSVLAVSSIDYDLNSTDDLPGEGPRIFLYRWDTATSDFVLLNSIASADLFSTGSNLRYTYLSLAGQTVGANSAAARAPVLWVGDGQLGYNDPGERNPGALARLTLSADGSVTAKDVAIPGTTATAHLPLTAAGSGGFGSVLQGTSSSTRVIVGAPETTVNRRRQAGAVVVYNSAGASQLLTQDTPGIPGTAESNDFFGLGLFVSTVASAAAAAPVSLFIGSPGESIGNHGSAGSAVQLRYSGTAASTAGARFWYQGSKGVAGTPETGDSFGWSFEALTVRGAGAPKFLVGVPDEDLGTTTDTGAIDVLGDGRAFDASSVSGQRVRAGQFFGSTLASWPGVDDPIANDPDPAPASGQWSRWIVIGSRGSYPPRGVQFGLPAGTFESPTLFAGSTGSVFSGGNGQ